MIPPGHRDGVNLALTFPDEKKKKRADIIAMILNIGVISRGRLESLIGKLSFPQTSIFGRFGLPAISPL